MTDDSQPNAAGAANIQVAGSRVDILLAEDNPDDVKLALHAFRRNNLTNSVHVVSDGAEALDFVFCRGAYASRSVDEPPKMLLLDLKMPLVDGLEVLQAVRANPGTRLIPVVMMTASREEQDRVESYALGVNSYIVKPLDFDQFVEAMRLVGMYWLLLNQPPKG
jgi:two-component system response regulator